MKSKILILHAILMFVLFANPLYAETCHEDVLPSTPSSDFINNGNATVTHVKTGLMWKVCSEGQTFNDGTCSGTIKTYGWSEALSLASTSDFSGYNDWRLPNIKELSGLVELSCYGPSINLSIFPKTSASNYWSSSTSTEWDASVWAVTFYSGNTFSIVKSSRNMVRLVRSE